MILLSFILQACQNESNCPCDDQKIDVQKDLWNNPETIKLDSLKSEIVRYGSIDAYGELILWDWNHQSDGIFMFHLIMATEYNYVDAYSNAFSSLLRQYENYGGMEYKDLSENSKEFLLYLLRKGAENGEKSAQAQIDRIKEKGEP